MFEYSEAKYDYIKEIKASNLNLITFDVNYEKTGT